MRKKLREQLTRLKFDRGLIVKFEGVNMCYYFEISHDGITYHITSVYDNKRVEAKFLSAETVIDVMIRDGVVYMRP